MKYNQSAACRLIWERNRFCLWCEAGSEKQLWVSTMSSICQKVWYDLCLSGSLMLYNIKNEAKSKE